MCIFDVFHRGKTKIFNEIDEIEKKILMFFVRKKCKKIIFFFPVLQTLKFVEIIILMFLPQENKDFQ